MRKKLSPEQIQRALHLHRSELMNVSEIAERIGCKESAVEDLFDEFERRRRASETVENAKRVAVDPLKVARLILSDERRDSLPHVSRSGPGRRFTKREVEEIKKAIRQGRPMVDIRTEFHCRLDPILRLRRQMGLYHDLRRRPQVPENVREQVLKLLPDHSVLTIQGMLKLSHRKVCEIADSVGGASALKTRGSGRRIRGVLKGQILERLRAGRTRGEIKQEFGVSLSAITALHQREKGNLDAPPSTVSNGKTKNQRNDQSGRSATSHRTRNEARHSAGPQVPTRIKFADAHQCVA